MQGSEQELIRLPLTIEDLGQNFLKRSERFLPLQEPSFLKGEESFGQRG